MTYDVQRWQVSINYLHRISDKTPLQKGRMVVVLAADAEAHEKAAVREAQRMSCAEEMFTDCPCFTEGREQAIRDCITAVEACTADKGYVYSDTETGVEWALAALRARLEGEK